MASTHQPTARAPTDLASDLAFELSRQLYAALTQAETARQITALEEAIRHVKGIQRAIDKARQ